MSKISQQAELLSEHDLDVFYYTKHEQPTLEEFREWTCGAVDCRYEWSLIDENIDVEFINENCDKIYPLLMEFRYE